MWYRLRIPLFICLAFGILGFVQEFVAAPWAEDTVLEVTTWLRIIGGFAMFIGAYSLLHMHTSRIRRKMARIQRHVPQTPVGQAARPTDSA